MHVLIAGANGFIGQGIVAAFLAAGHRVTGAVRDPAAFRRRFPGAAAVSADFNTDTDSGAWLPRLVGIDAVVNAAGVLRGGRGQSIAAIHIAAPRALFAACAAAGVRRVIHISAISADAGAGTEYAATKREAEQALAATALDWVILRPSLIYAQGTYGGTSLIAGLAGCPELVPLPGRGLQRFSPLARDDLAALVLRLAEDRTVARVAIDAVGPETLTLRDLLDRWRAWLGFPPARFLPLPMPLMRAAARLGDWFSRGALNSVSLRQIEHGNAGEPGPALRRLLPEPRTLAAYFASHPAHVQDRWHARLYFLRPAIRVVLALLWLVSGVLGLVSLGALAASLAAATGLPLPVTKAGAAALCAIDLALAAALVVGVFRRAVGKLQFAVVAGYTLAISFVWPALWLDPLGPLLKNLPILVLLLVAMAIEDDR